MHIISADSYEEMSIVAADLFEEYTRNKPNACLSCAAGSTQLGLYRELASRYKESGRSFRDFTFFNMDEYYGLTAEHPFSLGYFLNQNLYLPLDADPDRVHLPETGPSDTEKISAYDEEIEKHGGLDLLILGIGADGHIAFNMPDEVFHMPTHKQRLADDIIAKNRAAFENPDEAPTHAVTIGMKSIMGAKKIILMANGESKKQALTQLLNEDTIDPRLPASILRLHRDVTVIADRPAFG